MRVVIRGARGNGGAPQEKEAKPKAATSQPRMVVTFRDLGELLAIDTPPATAGSTGGRKLATTGDERQPPARAGLPYVEGGL